MTFSRTQVLGLKPAFFLEVLPVALKLHQPGSWCGSLFFQCVGHLLVPLNLETLIRRFWKFSSIVSLMISLLCFAVLFLKCLLFRCWTSWTVPLFFFFFLPLFSISMTFFFLSDFFAQHSRRFPQLYLLIFYWDFSFYPFFLFSSKPLCNNNNSTVLF